MKILAKTALGLVLTASAVAGATAPAAAQSYRHGYYGNGYDRYYDDGYRHHRYRGDWNDRYRGDWNDRDEWRHEHWRHHHRHHHDWGDRHYRDERRDWRRY